MARNQSIENIFGTILCATIILIFVAFVPYQIVTSESHKIITAIGRLRIIGPFIILLGIVGYLICFYNFVKDAKGSPIMGDSQRLIVSGLYKYVWNPIYISMYLVLLGEAMLYQSLSLCYYLLGWVILFLFIVPFVEEPFLRVKFGDQYDRYCKSVPRWIPRLKTPKKKK